MLEELENWKNNYIQSDIWWLLYALKFTFFLLNIENDYCHVLGVENGATTPGSTVTYFPQEYTTLGNEHLWLRGKADKNGYFTFQNPASGLFLTCVNAFNTKIESK